MAANPPTSLRPDPALLSIADALKINRNDAFEDGLILHIQKKLNITNTGKMDQETKDAIVVHFQLERIKHTKFVQTCTDFIDLFNNEKEETERIKFEATEARIRELRKEEEKQIYRTNKRVFSSSIAEVIPTDEIDNLVEKLEKANGNRAEILSPYINRALKKQPLSIDVPYDNLVGWAQLYISTEWAKANPEEAARRARQ